MNVLERHIDNDIAQAMKNGDKRRLDALRLIKTAITREQTKTGIRRVMTPEDDIAILRTLVKQGTESAMLYDQGGRPDLSEHERENVKVYRHFLPEDMNEDDLGRIVQNAIDKFQATSIKDMGKVMAAVKLEVAGRADNKVISDMVKRQLELKTSMQV
jgi:uncharacterized protein YqeY